MEFSLKPSRSLTGPDGVFIPVKIIWPHETGITIVFRLPASQWLQLRTIVVHPLFAHPRQWYNYVPAKYVLQNYPHKTKHPSEHRYLFCVYKHPYEISTPHKKASITYELCSYISQFIYLWLTVIINIYRQDFLTKYVQKLGKISQGLIASLLSWWAGVGSDWSWVLAKLQTSMRQE